MNQKELPSTPVFSPINRKYATVTPHPGKGARKGKYLECIEQANLILLLNSIVTRENQAFVSYENA